MVRMIGLAAQAFRRIQLTDRTKNSVCAACEQFRYVVYMEDMLDDAREQLLEKFLSKQREGGKRDESFIKQSAGTAGISAAGLHGAGGLPAKEGHLSLRHGERGSLVPERAQA